MADRMSTLRPLTTANKMNNLDVITFSQTRLRPLVATDDLLIELNGDSRRFERQLADQIVQHRLIRHFPVLTVKLKQQPSVPYSEDLSGRMILRNSAVSPSIWA